MNCVQLCADDLMVSNASLALPLSCHSCDKQLYTQIIDLSLSTDLCFQTCAILLCINCDFSQFFLQGCIAQVLVKNGNLYEGIFRTFSPKVRTGCTAN